MRPVDPIAQLLEGTYPDPETGAPLGAEARAIAIEDTLDGAEAELLERLGLGPRLALIADVDTFDALGRRVARALGGRFTLQTVVLDRAPHADAATRQRLAAAVDARTDAVVAVGSGTINDLAKLVAHERRVPQVVFATAPSMNGYTSVSASVLEHGVKRSIRTATPVGAFFDLGVLAAAPKRLVRAGLGDSVCRSTAQADWLLSHLLLDRPYREAPFALLSDDEHALFAEPAALVGGDRAAMRHLVRTLVLSGFGMTICGGSYPASEGEHLIAHYLSMTRAPGAEEPLHGEEIGVCTLAMATLQEDWLARDTAPVVLPSTITRADVVAHFGEIAGDTCWRELEPKLHDRARAEALSARLAAQWDAIRARIESVTIPCTRIRAVLDAAGAATTAAALGWSPAHFARAMAHAREIRNRYTFLDLEADAAILRA